VHFRKSGSKSFPVLVCLHGFLGDGRDWLPFQRELQKREAPIRLLLPDLPGHGHSPSLPDCSIPHLADALLAELDKMGIKQFALLGYSFGGRIAMAAAARYPERVVRLIGLSTTTGISSAKERATRRKQDEALAQRVEKIDGVREWEDFFSDWWSSPVFASPRWQPELFQKFVSRRCAQDPLAVAKVLRQAGTGRQSDYWRHLANYPHPALFLAGAHDDKFSRLATAMAETAPCGASRILPDCGHMLPLEAPALCVREVETFLRVTGFAKSARPS